MATTPIDVFLSVGRACTEQQAQFVASMRAVLAANDLRTITVATAETREDPLRLVMSLMNNCDGAVLVAFERLAIDKGREWRGTANERAISDTYLTTPWNQIEGAIAYSRNLPLLILKEHSVRAEGLLERGWQRYLHTTRLDSSLKEDPAFQDIFDRWLWDVRQQAWHVK